MNGMLEKLKILGLIVAGLLFTTIVAQNTDTVETRILFFTVSMPRAVLLFGTALIGFALGVIVATRLIAKGRRKKA